MTTLLGLSGLVALIGTDTKTLSDYWGTLYATTRFLEQLGVLLGQLEEQLRDGAPLP